MEQFSFPFQIIKKDEENGPSKDSSHTCGAVRSRLCPCWTCTRECCAACLKDSLF